MFNWVLNTPLRSIGKKYVHVQEYYRKNNKTRNLQETADWVTLTEEILKWKTSFFVQWTLKSNMKQIIRNQPFLTVRNQKITWLSKIIESIYTFLCICPYSVLNIARYKKNFLFINIFLILNTLMVTEVEVELELFHFRPVTLPNLSKSYESSLSVRSKTF